jgi:hypothetical protein
MWMPTSRKPRCAGCKKLAPVHYRGTGNQRSKCCRSFHYFVNHSVWEKATDDSDEYRIEQLCLFCLRKWLGRDLTEKDFIKDAFFFNGVGYTEDGNKKRGKALQKAYIRRMVRYANSGKNTSKVW